MTIDQMKNIGTGIRQYPGYCLVPSATKRGTLYKVTTDEHGHSIRCNCDAGSFNQDCGHRVAVDHFRKEKRNSCILCGHETKQTICGRCLG